MVKIISAVFFFLIGILILLFFRHYHGNSIPYPTLIWLSGFVFILIAYLLFRSSNADDRKQMKAEMRAFVDDIKKNGERIVVNFADCEIKSNNYSEEHKKNTGLYSQDIEGLNALTDETRNTEVVNIYQNIIVYKCNLNDKKQRFSSPVIRKDRAYLLIKLDIQKQTIIYVDRKNPSIYYFDLEFLGA